MRIFVKTLEGKTVLFDVESCESVLSVKKRLAAEHGVDFDRCILMICGKKMANDELMCDHNIQTESTLHVIYRKVKIVGSLVGPLVGPPMKDVMMAMIFIGLLPIIFSIRRCNKI
jgi:ubiquitin C